MLYIKPGKLFANEVYLKAALKKRGMASLIGNHLAEHELRQNKLQLVKIIMIE